MNPRPMVYPRRAHAQVWLGCLGLLLGACATPPASAPHAGPAVPAAFSGAAPHHLAASTARETGWQVFGDATLEALIVQALLDSPSIEAATARLRQARALQRLADGATAPQVTLASGANRQGGPLINAAGASGTLLTAGVSVAYEIDLLGRGRPGREAAALDAQASASHLRAAQLLVQAEVAQHYFALRALDAERACAQAGVQAWQEALRLTEQRWRAGAITEQPVLRLQGEAATAQAELAALNRRRAETEHALALLLGVAASGYALPEARWAADVPTVPAGLPSEMLARRPDVAAARQAEAAALARSGAARAAWWPSLVLTASGGHASAGLADWLQASTRAWGLGALLSLPLLDGGRRDAGIEQADALAQAESAQRRLQILTAFKEVEDQLAALSSLAEQARHQAQAQAAALRARTLAESRVRRGLASPLELLDAVRFELRSQRGVLQVQAAQLQATVGLIKALGGGWSDAGPT